MEEDQKLKGTVVSVSYHSTANGFSVFVISTGGECFNAVGSTPNIFVGEDLLLTGKFVTHPVYGNQFKAEFIEHFLPTDELEILRYLSNGAVRGIGPSLAKRIVERFGRESLFVIENDPEKLADISGISIEKAEKVSEEFHNMAGINNLLSFLASYQIEPFYGVELYKKYGSFAEDEVRKDPYLLCNCETPINFNRVDQIASDIGIEQESVCRLKGCIIYVLNHNFNNGHICLPKDKLIEKVSDMLRIEPQYVEEAYIELCDEARIVSDLREDREFSYLADSFLSESYIADRLSFMLSMDIQDKKATKKEIDDLEKELNITYAQKQRKAIQTAISSHVMILTGGPGTGKTTTLKGIITLMVRRGMTVALAAPTGRAAKRMSELSGMEAKTIHRLLEVEPISIESLPRFKRNEKNTLDADAVIIDEVSMIDERLFCSLLKAIRMNSRLVLVGDPDQLPSVGAGDVLKDLINSTVIPAVHLTDIFRQAEESKIVTYAHKVVEGIHPTALDYNSSDLYFISSDSSDYAAQTIAELCSKRLPKAYGCDPVKDIQVISPSKQRLTGCFELNQRLQGELNPKSFDKEEISRNGIIYRVGDKIMQTKNNYDVEWVNSKDEDGTGIFNGDIGTILKINHFDKTATLAFDDKIAEYSYDDLDEVDHAYAITVHKSQGNEFDFVIIPLVDAHPKLSYRNLLYTAVTRAKKMLIIVGKEETINQMIDNDKKTLRFTNLKYKIIEQNPRGDQQCQTEI